LLESLRLYLIIADLTLGIESAVDTG